MQTLKVAWEEFKLAVKRLTPHQSRSHTFLKRVFLTASVVVGFAYINFYFLGFTGLYGINQLLPTPALKIEGRTIYYSSLQPISYAYSLLVPGDGVEEAAKALQVYHLTNTSAEGNAEVKRQLVTTFEQEHDYSLSPFTAEVLTVHEQWQKQQIEENLNPALVAEVVAEAIGEFKQGADLNTQAGLVDEVLNGANESPHAYVVREEILSALEYQQFLVENDTPAITDGIQAHKQEPGRYYLYHFVEHSNVRVLDIKYTGYVPVLESASGIDYLIYMR